MEHGMDLEAFNDLPEAQARERLLTCLGVERWADDWRDSAAITVSDIVDLSPAS